MKKFNNYLKWGLLINSIFLLTTRISIVPEFIKGLCAGLGITLIFTGIYFEKHNTLPLREYKKNLLNKIGNRM